MQQQLLQGNWLMRGTSYWRHHARSLATALLLLAGATEAYGTDTYNSSNNQLTIPAVVIGSATYSNVVVTVGSILSVQQGTPNGSEDSFNPANEQLTIPNVQVGGGALDGQTFCNVVVTPGNILAVGGELPRVPEDTYNPANQQLIIAAVSVLGTNFVFTNVDMTVTNVVSYNSCGTGAPIQTLTAAQGDQQIALAGSPLPRPLVAVATVNGIDTANVNISFSDGGVGGTFEPQTATTDSTGS